MTRNYFMASQHVEIHDDDDTCELEDVTEDLGRSTDSSYILLLPSRHAKAEDQESFNGGRFTRDCTKTFGTSLCSCITQSARKITRFVFVLAVLAIALALLAVVLAPLLFPVTIVELSVLGGLKQISEGNSSRFHYRGLAALAKVRVENRLSLPISLTSMGVAFDMYVWDQYVMMAPIYMSTTGDGLRIEHSPYNQGDEPSPIERNSSYAYAHIELLPEGTKEDIERLKFKIQNDCQGAGAYVEFKVNSYFAGLMNFGGIPFPFSLAKNYVSVRVPCLPAPPRATKATVQNF